MSLMKRPAVQTFVCALAVCLVRLPAAQTLRIDDGYGKSGTHYDIHFVGDDTGFVVGDPGLHVTYDGGESWSGDAKAPGTLRSIDFPTRTNGHAVGEGGLYVRSTDGGETWEAGDSRVSTRLRAVSFADERYGLAAGDGGTVVLTTDGGDSWEQADASFVKPGTSDPAVFTGGLLLDRETGFVCGTGGALYKTVDGGESWHDRSPGGESVFALTFPSDSVGYASGAGSLCYKTVDRGESWAPMALPAPAGQEWALWSIAFVNTEIGVAVGGHVFFTNDGGSSWTLVKSGGQELRGLGVVNDTVLVAVGKASRQVDLRIEGPATTVMGLPPLSVPARSLGSASSFLLNGRRCPAGSRLAPQYHAAGHGAALFFPSRHREGLTCQ